MPWLQLTFSVDRERAPLLEAALESAGALAVTLGDAGDAPLLEPPPGATPLWEGVRMTALFEDDLPSRALVDELAHDLGHLSQTAPEIETLADRPWERAWMTDFRPTRFGDRLWVCPMGQAAPDPNAVVVSLDPGLAFGTGHHPTTALCLEWLDRADLAGRTLLDYGCGSGILAIAALKLGAARAWAVDHDPQALDATRDNAQANGVSHRLWTGLPPELDQILGEDRAELLVANILAGPLVELAPTLHGCLRRGGALALSGVIAEQVESVRAAYEDQLHLEPTRLMDGWALISGVKRMEPHAPAVPPCP
jgi:ribosomal protein L11 methyltransferase